MDSQDLSDNSSTFTSVSERKPNREKEKPELEVASFVHDGLMLKLEKQKKALETAKIPENNEFSKNCKETFETLKAKYKKTDTRKISSSVQQFVSSSSAGIDQLLSTYDDFKIIFPTQANLDQDFDKAETFISEFEAKFK